MTKIVIVGAAGRMGQAIILSSKQLEDIEIVGAIEADNHPDLGKDIGTICGTDEMGVKLTFDLQEALENADVMIDFTFHTVVPGNIAIATGASRAAVIGTTGLDEDETSVVMQAGAKIPIVWAPNMSVGVNLLFAMVKKASAVLSGYEIDIDETHHIHKKDAPSGTALRLGEKVAEGLGKNLKDEMIHVEEDADAGDTKGKILIRSHREGEVIGDHTVAFRNSVESVEFTHHAENRGSLALGSLHAAKWVEKQRPGVYDMQDVLALK